MSTEHDPKEKGVNQNNKNETEEIGGLFAGIKKIMKWVKKSIHKIISPFWTPSPLSPTLLLGLKSRTGKILNDISALLKHDTVKDETDRKMIVEAVAFIENPTENLADIKNHTTNIGHVLGGFEQQGADLPPEIDAMHHYLLALQCTNLINFVEKELEQSSPALAKIQQAMVPALDWAKIISNGYKDGTLLKAVKKLQGRLDSL
ncbi:MAG: hypothetical protein WC843_00230 [Candidatus Gracilibacteria bacterium]|jgi:hypothetical protein